VVTNRTRQRRTALVRQWETSSEPRRAFARRHGLTVSQFDYWKRQVRRVEDPKADETEEPGGFARVHVIGGAGGRAGAGVEVELRGGERLTIHEGTSTDLVRAVVLALRAAC
jgi:hypothetical protein